MMLVGMAPLLVGLALLLIGVATWQGIPTFLGAIIFGWGLFSTVVLALFGL